MLVEGTEAMGWDFDEFILKLKKNIGIFLSIPAGSWEILLQGNAVLRYE